MIGLAANSVVRKALRIAIVTRDPVRRGGLRQILNELGYEIVEITSAADVVLADGESTSGEGAPVVQLGGRDESRAGLLPQDASPDQIDAALRAAAAGLIVRASIVASADFDMEHAPQNLLTPRENEVLSAIAAGLSNKAIARQLDISLHTVKFHIESLLRKLGARSRAEAVAKGLAHRKDVTIEI
jgi:DNA-binding NarL/FixJ family response regulator